MSVELDPAARELLGDRADAHVALALLTALRKPERPWWNAAHLVDIWPVAQRMEWLADRAAARASAVTKLTGLSAAAAERLSGPVQTDLIQAVLDAGDVGADQIEQAFPAVELAASAPTGEVLARFAEAVPWTDPQDGDGEAVGAAIDALLGSGAPGRQPVLNPLILRSAIDAVAWQEFLPARLRASVDQARLRREWEHAGRPFTAGDELAIVTVDKLVEALPLDALKPVFDAAQRVVATMAAQDGGGEQRPEATEEVTNPPA